MSVGWLIIMATQAVVPKMMLLMIPVIGPQSSTKVFSAELDNTDSPKMRYAVSAKRKNL